MEAMDVDAFRRTLLARHACAGLLAALAETAVAFPLDTLKVVTQVRARPGAGLSTGAAFQEATAGSGNFLKLYKGAAVSLVGRAPALAVRYGVYGLACGFHLDGKPYGQLTLGDAASAGALAGTAESLINAPLELIKTRLQAATPLHPSPRPPALASPHFLSLLASQLAGQSGGASAAGATDSGGATRGAPAPASARGGQLGGVGPPRGGGGAGFSSASGPPTVPRPVARALAEYPWLPRGAAPAATAGGVVAGTVKVEGWRSLWRGARATWARDTAYGATFFAAWVYLERVATEVEALRAGVDPRLVDPSAPLPPAGTAAAAAGAAAMAAAVSHPLDTTKTRTQATVLPQHVVRERALLRIRESLQWWEAAAGLRVWEKGVHWHGLGLRVLHHSAAAMVLVGTYQLSLGALTAASRPRGLNTWV